MFAGQSLFILFFLFSFIVHLENFVIVTTSDMSTSPHLHRGLGALAVTGLQLPLQNSQARSPPCQACCLCHAWREPKSDRHRFQLYQFFDSRWSSNVAWVLAILLWPVPTQVAGRCRVGACAVPWRGWNTSCRREWELLGEEHALYFGEDDRELGLL